MANNIPVPGYPTAAWGQTKVSKVDHWGQANYSTGGEIISPAVFGMGGLESIGAEFGAYATSQNYFVRAVPPANSQSTAENQAPTWNGNNNTSQIALKWFVAANSNEVAANTNLSGEVVRIVAFGV